MRRAQPWNPWLHLRQHHPDVRVHEVELPRHRLGCVDLARRIVWLDWRLTDAERRSTLAHEIGHLERGMCCDPIAQPAEERAVDDWAARLLIDARALVRAIQWSAHLPEIADELCVDMYMVEARLRGLTDDEQDFIVATIMNRATAA